MSPKRRGLTPPERAAQRRRQPKRSQARVTRIWELLSEMYPDAHCELDYESPVQLLVAVVLSAQCTDVRVNKVTPELFRQYPDPYAMAEATQEQVEELVRTTGFFRNKAKNIRGLSRRLVEEHDGEVPQGMDELLALPGVARKTANCVQAEIFGECDGVVVDTHVMRISRLLELTEAKDAVKVEEDLCWRFPQEIWPLLSHRMIWHGRRVCIARRPRCGECDLVELCPSAQV